MKEDYCSFELSKLAKEKGFNWPVRAVWAEIEGEWRVMHASERKWNDREFAEDGSISAPTHCHLAKWLREVHGIIVFVDWKYAISPFYHIITPDNELIGNVEENHHDAFEAGLKKALKLIKK